MTEEIDGIVAEFRENVCEISDEEVAEVIWLCQRKIEITGQKEDYMKLLLPDELKNHCFRNVVSALSILRMHEKEWSECAVCV